LEALEDRALPSTLTVSSAADNGSSGTLRAVLAAAQSGDTIRFARQLDGQTITLTQGQLTVSENLSIVGPGAAALSISGGGAGRIFDVDAGVTATISGLTLTGGMATDGGAVLNAGSLTLSQDLLSNDTAQGVAGGGLFGDGGGRGGAVVNQAGATLNVTFSTFSGDQALGSSGGGNAFGGAIYNQAGSVTISQSTVTGNQAVGGNGGSTGTSVTLPGSYSATFLGVAVGGGVWNDGGSLAVSNSSLKYDVAQGGNDANTSAILTPVFVDAGIGGAIGSGNIFSTTTPNITITGGTLDENKALGGTNAIVAYGSTAVVAVGDGGAVTVIAGNLSVTGSVIAGNLAESGALTFEQGGSVSRTCASAANGGGICAAFNFGLRRSTAFLSLTVTGVQLATTLPSATDQTGLALAADRTLRRRMLR
jgi:hypothetical protein